MHSAVVWEMIAALVMVTIIGLGLLRIGIGYCRNVRHTPGLGQVAAAAARDADAEINSAGTARVFYCTGERGVETRRVTLMAERSM